MTNQVRPVALEPQYSSTNSELGAWAPLPRLVGSPVWESDRTCLAVTGQGRTWAEISTRPLRSSPLLVLLQNPDITAGKRISVSLPSCIWVFTRDTTGAGLKHSLSLNLMYHSLQPRIDTIPITALKDTRKVVSERCLSYIMENSWPVSFPVARLGSVYDFQYARPLHWSESWKKQIVGTNTKPLWEKR